MKTISIGIVGTGGMGKIHASAYMKHAQAKVLGVSSITRDLAQAFADGQWQAVAYSEGELQTKAAYKIERVYDTWQEMAADRDIDAVSIVVPNVLHAEIARGMILAGKHVLVEKPLAISLEQSVELVDLARQQGVLLATGHMWRYHQDVAWLKRMIDEGMLGEIVQTKSYSMHLRWGPGGWFARKDMAGGGALIDMGVHAIDTTRYLLGEPQVKSVYASVGSRFGQTDVDDYAQIMAKFDNGVTSLFESGWHMPVISGLEASTEVWGTRGYARLFPTSMTVQIGGQWGTFTPENTESHTSVAPYDRQVSDFVDAILGKTRCLVGDDVGLEVMRLVDAAYRSAETDQLIMF